MCTLFYNLSSKSLLEVTGTRIGFKTFIFQHARNGSSYRLIIKIPSTSETHMEKNKYIYIIKKGIHDIVLYLLTCSKYTV